MRSVIQALREDHRNIRRLLSILDHHIALLANGGDPVYDLLAAIADYFCDYPDHCHHPKEDVLFRRLQAVHPEKAAEIGDLTREHRDAHARVRRFRDCIQAVFRDNVLPREKVIGAARSFVNAELEHMTMEEEVFFPAAIRFLKEEDWRAVESDLKRIQDPIFGPAVEEDFRALRDSLLAWERETGRGQAKYSPRRA